jgi:hypothetical protein
MEVLMRAWKSVFITMLMLVIRVDKLPEAERKEDGCSLRA